MFGMGLGRLGLLGGGGGRRYDYVIDGVNGSDGNPGAADSPWATTAPLRTAILALPASGTITALVKQATYDENSHFGFSTVVAANVYVRVDVEPGTVFQGADGADASFTNISGNNPWLFEIVGLGPIKGPSQPRITRWNAGTGNGFGSIQAGNLIGRNLRIDDCVDGWSMHGIGNTDIYDCVISNCSKAALAHAHTGGKGRSFRCDFTGKTGASLGVGSDTSSGDPTEHYGSTFTPSESGQVLGLGDAVLSGCVLGTMTARLNLTPLTGASFASSFVNGYIDANQSAAFDECYGFLSVRHRNGGGITGDHCIFGGGATGQTDALVFSNFNPGAGSPIGFTNTIITGYGADAIGNGMDATTAAQYIDAGAEIAYCCLYVNTSNFDAQVSADDGFAAAVHDNITTDPKIGPATTTAKADWVVAADSPCIGAGEGGSNIGFRVAA